MFYKPKDILDHHCRTVYRSLKKVLVPDGDVLFTTNDSVSGVCLTLESVWPWAFIYSFKVFKESGLSEISRGNGVGNC